MVGKFKRRYESFRNNPLFAALQIKELDALGQPDYDGHFDRLVIGHAQTLPPALLDKYALVGTENEQPVYLFCIGDTATQVRVRPHLDNEVEFSVRP